MEMPCQAHFSGVYPCRRRPQADGSFFLFVGAKSRESRGPKVVTSRALETQLWDPGSALASRTGPRAGGFESSLEGHCPAQPRAARHGNRRVHLCTVTNHHRPRGEFRYMAMTDRC
jgi:hypothetical protein